MTLTISQAFDLPAREDITALGFVVRLSEAEDHLADERLVRDYVITPTVALELPVILSSMRHTFAARGDLGRFVHGSFGSGKSHFLAYLGLLLEGHDFAWSKDAAPVRAVAPEHRGWIEGARLLVVRLHMLTADGGSTGGFDRAVYNAANAALARHGKPLFEFLHIDGVLQEARREAAMYGPAFWKRLAEDGIIGSQGEFEAQTKSTPDLREALARAYLTWKGRDATSAGVDPNWATGLANLAKHVKAHGFGGLVLVIDELLLWLRAKSGPEFERAINQLNVIVDHADGARAVPVFAFVARQRNIQEFFPDLVEEQQLHEHLGHHAKRFEVTSLEDVELRHVCKGRVLKRRPEHEAEIQRVVDALARDHEKVLPAILHGADIGYLRDVYPFHPALIEMLIDVSSLMQRDRTALRLLYELLVLHYPDVPLGKLVPVGWAFEAIFPEVGLSLETEKTKTKRHQDLIAIHRTYYQRLRPAMAQMRADPASDFDEIRQRTLDAIVKTALLGEVSPRLKGTTSMTIERLVRLNDAEVTGETDRSKFNKVHQDMLVLARLVPGVLQLSGQGKEATVTVVLQGVNFGEILERARARVAGHKNPLLRAFYSVLLPAIGLKRDQVGDTVEFEWRKTKRKGTVDIKNVRELSNADFKVRSGEDLRIVIDYPWDEGGTMADDELRANDVRRRDGSQLTVCWLPRHFKADEMAVLRDLAAVEEILGPAQEELLRDLAPHDRSQVGELAESQAQNLRQSLKARLGEVYRDQGRLVPLISNIDANVPGGELDELLARLARMLLDRAYSAHPNFGAEPKADGLRVLCEWLCRASERPEQMEGYNDDEAKVLRTLGEPLELVSLGQTRGQLRLDTRYIKTVRDEAKGESVLWDAVDRRLTETYALPLVVRNFFLKFIQRLDSFRAVHAINGDPIEVEIDNRTRSSVKLVRAPLLELAEWGRVRDLGSAVLELPKPSTTRTLAEQDRFAAEVRRAARDKHTELQGLHERLAALGAASGKRPGEIKTALARLGALTTPSTEPAAMLRAFLAGWPDDEGSDVRVAVVRVATVREALGTLDETARRTLESARTRGGPLGGAVEAHLGSLLDLLICGELERPLTKVAVIQWNTEARDLLARLIQQTPAPAPAPPLPPAPPPPAPPPPGTKKVERRLRAGDESARRALEVQIENELRGLGDAEVDVLVTITPRRP